MDVKTAWAWWMLGRDVVLFFAGLGILWHEATQYVGPERKWVYLVAAGLGFSPLFTPKRKNDAPSPTPDGGAT